MDNYLKHTPDFDVFLNTDENYLSILCRLHYRWNNEQNTSPWSDFDKRQLIADTNRFIWHNISEDLVLKSKGKSSFAKNNKGTEFQVHFIHQIIDNMPHWTIEVNKTRPGDSAQTYIQWALRKIHIGIEDGAMNNSHGYNNQPSSSSPDYLTQDNGYWDMHQKEFSSPIKLNTFNLSTIGNQLRDSFIKELLNTINDTRNPLIPKTEFLSYTV